MQRRAAPLFYSYKLCIAILSYFGRTYFFENVQGYYSVCIVEIFRFDALN